MSFVTDVIDNAVCPGLWINKKNGKVHSPGLQSPHIGYATLAKRTTHSWWYRLKWLLKWSYLNIP